jgi:GNAT superfamily N-acetyltransferase
VNVELRSARRDDLPTLVRYIHALHRLQGRPFSLFRVEGALLPLLNSAQLGRAWIIEAGGRPAGYIALCYGYSLASGGTDALVDGFFIEEEFRHRGIGRGVLRQVLDEARAAGAVAVHMQPGTDAARARRLFKAAGYEAEDQGAVLCAVLVPASPGKP